MREGVLQVERGEYDARALQRCAHPPELRKLASHEALLCADPSDRMRLDELADEIEAQERRMQRTVTE